MSSRLDQRQLAATDQHNPVIARPRLELSDCDRESIHLCGAVQPHGVLLTLSQPDGIIQHVSRNSGELLGLSPAELLGQPVESALGAAALQAVAEGLALPGGTPNPLHVPICVAGQNLLFDGVVHRSGKLAVLELENPRSASDVVALQGVTDRHHMLIHATLNRLTRCKSLEEAAAAAAEEVRSFTGFDRIMVYQFDAGGSGHVIAESRVADVASYLGLHFPASDVPQQARRLYEQNWLRLISDVAYEPVAIQGGSAEEPPLDLTQSVLRSVSPVHVQYLKNMRVGASMSISLMRGERLWGLIACHHRTARYIAYPIRSACVLFGAVLSSQLAAIDQSRRADERVRKREVLTDLMHTVAAAGGVTAGLQREPERLLDLFAAGGAVVSFAGESELIGRTPSLERVEAILNYLDEINAPDVWATDALPSIWPTAARDTATACGVLALRFSSGDHLLFFRPEVVQTVRWAGDPRKPTGSGTADEHLTTAATDPDERPATPVGLSPRASFSAWVEQVRGRAAAWEVEELQRAEQFRNLLSSHILRHSEELVRLNRQLAAKNEEMAQFLYSVSHDLKSPLITCRGFVGLLREDLADGKYGEVEDFARRIDDAARFMSRMIDDLLDLHRLGRAARPPRVILLRPLLEELQAAFAVRLAEKSATLQLAEGLPESVHADPPALRRVLDNLISNAIKYGCNGTDRTVTVSGSISADLVRLCVADRGPGVPSMHREKVFQMFWRLTPYAGEGSGVGLASVAKVVRLHDGRAWVEDRPGGGAAFWIEFPTAASQDRASSPSVSAVVLDDVPSAEHPSSSSRQEA